MPPTSTPPTTPPRPGETSYIHLATIILACSSPSGWSRAWRRCTIGTKDAELEADLRQEALTNRSRIALNRGPPGSDMVWLLKLPPQSKCLAIGRPKGELCLSGRPPERTLTSTNRIGAFLPRG